MMGLHKAKGNQVDHKIEGIMAPWKLASSKAKEVYGDLLNDLLKGSVILLLFMLGGEDKSWTKTNN